MDSIVHFEATNILLAIRCWAKTWTDASVVIWCDNWAVINAFTYSKIRDNIFMATVRSVWLYIAKFNINLVVKHIAGKDNVYADALSRWQYYNVLNTVVVRVLKTFVWE